jgi:hypothetical protein
MKMIFRLAAVLGLSLLAARAEAQIDSNAKVLLHCYAAAQCHDMVITGMVSTDPIAGFIIDTSFRLPTSDSIHLIAGKSNYNTGSVRADFLVDTIHRCIRDIAFFVDNPIYFSGPSQRCHDWGCSEEANSVVLRLSLDSLPYSDSQGVISVSGVFTFSSSFIAQYSCQCLRQLYSGSCELLPSTQVDTLSIKIVPNAYSAVSEDSAARPFSVLDNESRFVLCSFALPQRSDAIQIFDLLGRVTTLPINVGNNTTSLSSLPPGCYFARLGNQVAKFVVPPR